MKFWGVVLIAMMLVGCNRDYREQIADLRAGVQAAQRTPDAAARSRLYTAIGARVLALTDGITDLPRPAQTVDEILADPEPFLAIPAVPTYETPPPAPPSPWQRWAHLGDELVFWGGIVGALGLVVVLVSGAAGWLGWAGRVWQFLGSPLVGGIARLSASLGGGSAAVGGGIVWATTYWWALVAAGVLAGVVFTILHWRDVRKLWAKVRRRPAP